jgi:hypothetical protein
MGCFKDPHVAKVPARDDQGYLLVKTPSQQMVREFKVLVELLLPFLKFTDWPDEEEFPDVPHRWPDIDTLQVVDANVCPSHACPRRNQILGGR